MKITNLRLKNILSNLIEKYRCHTVILYGSHARAEATETSDYDIIAIREKGDMERDCRLFENAYLDVFIYSEEIIQNPDDSFIRIKDGIVLCQKDTMGDLLLSKVKEKFSHGPRKIPDWEKEVIVTWSEKMFKRAEVGDIEGNYRRHWVLYDLLESYFQLRNQWYLGPKEAFKWLKTNDPDTYSLFDAALSSEANLTDIKKCIEQVTKKIPNE